jgi:hypothetical protein
VERGDEREEEGVGCTISQLELEVKQKRVEGRRIKSALIRKESRSFSEKIGKVKQIVLSAYIKATLPDAKDLRCDVSAPSGAAVSGRLYRFRHCPVYKKYLKQDQP